jgi:hypothetical protein
MVEDGSNADAPLMFRRPLHVTLHLTPVTLVGAGVGLVLLDEAPGLAWALIVWGLGLGSHLFMPASGQGPPRESGTAADLAQRLGGAEHRAYASPRAPRARAHGEIAPMAEIVTPAKAPAARVGAVATAR